MCNYVKCQRELLHCLVPIIVDRFKYYYFYYFSFKEDSFGTKRDCDEKACFILYDECPTHVFEVMWRGFEPGSVWERAYRGASHTIRKESFDMFEVLEVKSGDKVGRWHGSSSSQVLSAGGYQ